MVDTNEHKNYYNVDFLPALKLRATSGLSHLTSHDNSAEGRRLDPINGGVEAKVASKVETQHLIIIFYK
jgi:hypothetical protein